jgi:hypothetical protein
MVLIGFLCFAFSNTHKNEKNNEAIKISKEKKISLQEKICKILSEEEINCKKILDIDNSNVVFMETDSGIQPVLTNKDFTEIKKFIYPELNFVEFKEERGDRGPIIWMAKNKIEKNFSMISGFAEGDAKKIIINTEGNIEAKKILVKDNLWFWYVTFEKDKVVLPVKVTVYDEKGRKINK